MRRRGGRDGPAPGAVIDDGLFRVADGYGRVTYVSILLPSPPPAACG
ncbi:MAG TPA: hypothetical protein VF256_00515 [Streptosporangiaceae bacterium]